MFLGTTWSDLQKMLAETIRTWGDVPCAVACCGNFTLDRVLHACGVPAIRSCDVSLYTSALGAVLSGQPLPVTLRPEYAERWPWLALGMDNQTRIAATMMLITQIAYALDKPENPHYARLLRGYSEQWGALLDATEAKLDKVGVILERYDAQDANAWLGALPEDFAVITFPPFIDGGYEKMFAMHERLFEWPRPSYRLADDAWKAELITKVTQRGRWWLSLPYRHPDLEKHLVGLTRTSNRGLPVYTYASGSPVRVVTAAQVCKAPPLRHIVPGAPLQGELRILPLSTPEMNALRAQYLNPFIAPGTPSASYGVTVGDTLIGAFGISTHGSGPTHAGDLSDIYLLSDFACQPSDYPRLSKLVLMAALSQEAQRLYEKNAKRRVRAIVTTAFTNKPVSMKYRGLFTLLKRTELDPPREGSTMMLQYRATVGSWTLSEALARWQAQYTKERVS